ncbi:hypothetical protein HMPREF1619_04346 [Klebsiella pneumoniae 909957]|nr:hypothetical protein HMPREF1619_04346 [Klebsiella pneumoniae 909957]
MAAFALPGLRKTAISNRYAAICRPGKRSAAGQSPKIALF